MLVPTGYVSGTALSGSSTYDGMTIAGLGLTPGTYTYSSGTGADADSLTVNVGAVPEPSSLALATAALAGGLIVALAGAGARKPMPTTMAAFSRRVANRQKTTLSLSALPSSTRRPFR